MAYGEPRAKKVFYYNEGKMTPAWYTEVSARSVDLVDDYSYAIVVSAIDGDVLFRKNLTEEAAFNYRVYADASGINQPFDGPIGNGTNPYPNGSVINQRLPRVAATPNLVTLASGPISTRDPWLADGATVTTGNNVDSYLDIVDGNTNAPGTPLDQRTDGFTPNSADTRGTVNGSNTFSYPYLPDADPTTATQRQHAAVHLFYINNWLHDWWYDNGFDEAAGNSQESNFGRGGVEGDRMLVEGQDFSGTNNANQRTPADGGRPRQQMYLFDGPVNGEVTVSAPVGSVPFGTASFGPQVFDVSAAVSASAPLNGCTPFTNAAAVAGTVVIIDRGVCSFQTKTVNAQNAGAVGVIIANNVAGAPPGLAGDATQPAATIGTLSVANTSGAAIRAALANGPLTARLRRAASIPIDGTVDTQIVAHEWFHYASNRLVGNASGLSNQQGRGMGEGWSDFSALILSVRPEDRQVSGNNLYQGAYPVAVYSTQDSYFGIRRAPYSTDLNVFPFTFRHISDGVPLPTNAPILVFGANSQVHNTGSIWANTLWEFYVNLLNDPRYSFTQARERMKDYVIAGLKMTPNAPTMLEARDGILAAALARDPADFRLAATAFAKRGMGAGAVAPPRGSATNSGPAAVEDFTEFAGRVLVTSASLDFGYVNGATGFIDNDGILDPGETALLTINLVNLGTAPITSNVTAQLSSTADLTYANGGVVTFPASQANPIAIGGTATGTIEVTLRSATSTAQQITLNIAFPQVGATANEVFEAEGRTINLTVNYDIVRNSRATDDLSQPIASAFDWGRTTIGSGTGWNIVNGDPAPFLFATGNIWYVPDNGTANDIRLTTPPVALAATGPSRMTFSHYFEFEPDTADLGFDGGVIEISSDGGTTWRDIIAAGGAFVGSNGYNGRIQALEADGTFAPGGATNPAPGFIADNFAAANGFLDPVTVTLPASLAGSTVRLRFRHVSDSSVGAFGWSIDNISFTGATNTFSVVAAENGVPDNQAPVANAGPDRFVANGRVANLIGTASTDDAGITSFAWTQVSGPTVTINNPTAATANFTPTVNGTYVFSLRVTDVRTLSSTDTVTLTVITAPVANAGPDQTVGLRRTVNLDGRASTTDAGSTLTYAWTQTNGPVVTLNGATTATPFFSQTDVGSYVFTLTVTDSRSRATSTDTVTINAQVPTGGGSFGFLMLAPGLLAVLLRRRRKA